MTRKTIVFALFLIVLIPQVLALSSEIKVKTLPYHQVQLTTFDQEASSFTAFESFKQESDQYGDATFTFTSDKPAFGIIIYIKWKGETVVSKKYEESYETGKPILLTIAPDGARLLETPNAAINETNSTETPENETKTNETSATDSTATEESATEEDNNQQSITGLTVMEELSDSTKKTIYIVLVSIIALAIILMFVFKFRNKSKKLTGMDFKPASASKQDARLITNLEKKLKDAEHEITVLKNQEKIKEVERRIEEEKREIERLRSGF